MMLGGSENVRNLIWKHISADNEKLKSSISNWLRFLKWHQEFDWEEVAEYVLFGNSMPKIDAFWENEQYQVPEKYVSTLVWTPSRPNLADNIRKIVAAVPGFFYLIDREVEAQDEEEAANADKGIGQSSLEGFVTFGKQSTVSSQSLDLTLNGGNFFAFESLFMRHTVWKEQFI